MRTPLSYKPVTVFVAGSVLAIIRRSCRVARKPIGSVRSGLFVAHVDDAVNPRRLIASNIGMLWMLTIPNACRHPAPAALRQRRPRQFDYVRPPAL
jgi:hypothetical protein